MSEKVFLYSRFSSDEQERGDSLDRQKRACEAFAASRGWVITEHLTDKGRSAYKGEHLAADAALGAFTRQVDRGEIEPGSILLAEKLDRLSRRPIAEAMAWIYQITSQGVQIAIVDSGTVFEANPSLETYLGGAIRLATGHEESAKKSDRTRSAKRALWAMAESKTGKWTNLCGREPLWLTRNSTRDGWTVNEQRAAVIREIYQWSADGLGAQSISKRLNARNEKPWGIWRKYEARWGLTAINALLRNPAVEGDFVPKDGEYLGRAIRAFYPRVVDADLVAAARAAKSERRKQSGERARNGVSSLFAKLTVCGECGSRAYVMSSFSKGKRYAYVRCEGAREGRGCSNNGYYTYNAFEDTATTLLVDLALDDKFFAASGRLKELRNQKAETEKAISDRRQARARLLDLFEDGDDQVGDRLRALKGEIDGLTITLADLDKEIEQASGKVSAVEHIARLNDIRDAARSEDHDTREHARAKLHRAFSAITNSVSIERTENGGKVFTLALAGGIRAWRIDTKGTVVGAITEVGGYPPHHFLSGEQKAQVASLIRRIEERL